MDRPILSLLIPTNGATKWAVATIKGILDQEVSPSLYEIVVVDNAHCGELKRAVDRFGQRNIVYVASEYEGFDNTFYCFRYGQGLYRKLLNHRTLLKQGVLSRWIDLVQACGKGRPILYILQKHGKKCEVLKYASLDGFIKSLSYYFTWSLGVGMWDCDVQELDRMCANHYFPHATILFETRKDADYMIVEDDFQVEQDDAGKGGYDLFRYFGIEALNILAALVAHGRLSSGTFEFVRHDLWHFLCQLYRDEVIRKSRHAFIIRDVTDSLSEYYNWIEIIALKGWAYLTCPLVFLKCVMRECHLRA